MKKECYFCKSDAEIYRDNSYEKLDGDWVHCPECTQYFIDENAIGKISNWPKPFKKRLSNQAKKHFEETGEPFKFGTINIDLLKCSDSD